MTVGTSGTTLVGNAIRMAGLANFLQIYLRQPVVDKTNLNGLFDVRVPLTRQVEAPAAVPDVSRSAGPDVAPTPSVPSGSPIFATIQDELGLKLEPTKAALEVVVIDSVQKPSEN
jgi:uncharacterized protein (TIGR03435 family)